MTAKERIPAALEGDDVDRPTEGELSAADRRILQRVGPVLRKEGLFFVGIDVIGDCLTEINVTSPTGVQEVNALEDTRLEARVIERVESWVAEGRR